jgi:hypothetical protein
MATWYTANSDEELERAHAALPELPVENAELAGMLLDVARERVLTFAADDEPGAQVATLLQNLGVEESKITAVLSLLGFEVTDEGDIFPPSDLFPPDDRFPGGIPARYAWAQLQDAKNMWLAGRGEDGPEGFMFTARPLTKDIQRIIRPTSGVPNVF